MPHIPGTPGDPPLVCVSIMDARLERDQLTPERQQYTGAASGHLVSLRPGDVVVDVGANVGSWSRLAARAVGRTGRVVAVEPLPQVFEALKENCRAFSQCVGTADIEPVHAGIVPDPGPDGLADFTFFPRCAAFSTLARTRDDQDALTATWSLTLHAPLPPSTASLQYLGNTLARTCAWLYRPVHMAVARALLLGGARTVACPVMTLSQLIKDKQLERVDLLKVNVERGELGVLRSVEPDHWQRIQQVSMQLHDRGEALHEALALLTVQARFPHVHVGKEPRFADCCLVNVYASRRQQHTT